MEERWSAVLLVGVWNGNEQITQLYTARSRIR